MSPSFVSSARRRRHGGLASAALFHPLVEAATGALPVIDPATGRPVDSADAGPGSTPATPAQGADERRSSTEAGSARG
ncbi:hypothetical protein [Micrococcus endophyticus]|uniref:hypothetical protein n=1 Tax=Micrococcus endophyticus TaxID=455343 RepID=UPI0020043F07|nr:hypothetical protein [Micrococcus endophyticus]MCK6090183.1 hypothetical protein [Micrococcus endophyticus]